MNLSANSAALVFTVALVMVTAYYFLGSVPLLVLKHDNPMDAKFIRSFYDTYYRITFIVALGATLSYTFAGRPLFAMGAAANLFLALVLRRKLVPKMNALGTQIQANDTHSIPEFRKVHKTAILINLGQLVAMLSSLGMY
jgi:hypothetical protein